MITDEELAVVLKKLKYYREEDSGIYLTVVTTNQFKFEGALPPEKTPEIKTLEDARRFWKLATDVVDLIYNPNLTPLPIDNVLERYKAFIQLKKTLTDMYTLFENLQ